MIATKQKKGFTKEKDNGIREYDHSKSLIHEGKLQEKNKGRREP